MKDHELKFRSKLLHIRQGSAFYIHMVNEHKDICLIGQPIDKFFEVNTLKAYQSILTRLVDGGTHIRKYQGPILNSKSEWHQPKIIRNVIIQGGSENIGRNMGLRPQHSPQQLRSPRKTTRG